MTRKIKCPIGPKSSHSAKSHSELHTDIGQRAGENTKNPVSICSQVDNIKRKLGGKDRIKPHFVSGCCVELRSVSVAAECLPWQLAVSIPRSKHLFYNERLSMDNDIIVKISYHTSGDD